MTHFKLIQQLERDIRNQVLIDSLKRLNRKQKIMVHLNRNSLRYAFGFCALFWMALCVTKVSADELHVPCPTAEPCKILTLSAQEERLLTTQNGILDTAAQGRALELGQFSVYLKTRIATAPAGEPQKPAEPPMQPTPNQEAPVKHDAPDSAK
jgi:hypothetical protein